MSTLIDFLTDPTVHNAVLGSMGVTAIVTAMPHGESLKGKGLKDVPMIAYQYVYDVLHIFMSLKTGQAQTLTQVQQTTTAPTSPAPTAPASQTTTTITEKKENP